MLSTPPAMNHVTFASGDRVRGGVDRLQTGTAQAVDGLAGTSTGKPGQKRGHARHVAVVLAGLVRAAEDDVFDQVWVDPARANASMTSAARSSGRTSFSAPPYRPTGVRTA